MGYGYHEGNHHIHQERQHQFAKHLTRLASEHLLHRNLPGRWLLHEVGAHRHESEEGDDTAIPANIVTILAKIALESGNGAPLLLGEYGMVSSLRPIHISPWKTY